MRRIISIRTASAWSLALPRAPSRRACHLKGAKHAEPSFTDNGLTLTAAGELAWRGYTDVW